jgi:hypothetical protein
LRMRLGKILGPKEEQSDETGENCKIKSFMICTAYQILFRWWNLRRMKCAGHWLIWGRKKCIQCFGGEIRRKVTSRKSWP